MLQKVTAFCRQQCLLQKQDTVIVGISGGADSVCLLSICKSLQETLALRIEAVHVNHMLRGKNADADAAFTRNLCARFDIPCTVYVCRVDALAKKWGMSEEEAGRRVRYAVFAAHCSCVKKCGVSDGTVKIAVAHQMDDQAETVLMHLIRGGGLSGLSGMRPLREIERAEQRRLLQTAAELTAYLDSQTDADAVLACAQAADACGEEADTISLIRPLLCVSKREITGYLRERGLPFCEDESNASDRYTRNKIRRHVLSYITEEMNPSAVETLCRSAAQLAQADLFLRETADAALARCRKQTADGAVCVGLPEFLSQHMAVQGYMVRACLREAYLRGAGGQTKKMPLDNVTWRHISDICRLADGQTGKSLTLPDGMLVRRTYDALVFGGACPAEEETQSFSAFAVAVPGTYVLKETGETVTFSKKTYQKGEKIPNSAYTKWFDYDKIKCQLWLRGRAPGDYLTIDAAGRTKKLKEYLIESKCPVSERDRLPLLADGSHILWVFGFRISEAYKITDDTRVVLVVERTSGKDTNDE